MVTAVQSVQNHSEGDALTWAYHLCRRTLSIQDGGNFRPRPGFESEHHRFEKALQLIQEAAVDDARRAKSIARRTAITLVLDNPKAMAHFIKGAYEIYEKLTAEFGRGIEGREEWRDAMHHLESFEWCLAKVLNMEGQPSRRKLFEVVSASGFAYELAEIFAVQRELANSGNSPVFGQRINALNHAMSFYSRARWLLKQMEKEKRAEQKTAQAD